MNDPCEVARVPIPTQFGEFEARAFELDAGLVYLALVKGDVAGASGALVRLHSECLTGDALGSLRCDCGVQLRLALRAIAAAGCGVLVYATGHEGRGVGLVNKLRAYVEQDNGADTVDANLRLGLPVDARQYGDAAAVLRMLGVRSVRLLTNNPAKVTGLASVGIVVDRVEPLRTAAHARNVAYLRTKGDRLGHREPAGEDLETAVGTPLDATSVLGTIEPRVDRPYVIVKYAQTLDGRIATAVGDSKWISGEDERRVSHALRAACDAVLVGIGTVVRDDPELTVRMVPGASPMRVVLDSTLRTPVAARVLSADAATVLLTTARSAPAGRDALRSCGVDVKVVAAGPDGVDLAAGLRALRELGVTSLLVEGGARVITSMLAARLVDRLVVSTASKIIGAGTEAVGDLRIDRVSDGITLTNRRVHVMSDDVLSAWDVGRNGSAPAPAPAALSG